MSAVPRTLFVGRGDTGVAWYRCFAPAIHLGQDWIGVSGWPSHLQIRTARPGPGIPIGAWSGYDVVVLQYQAGEPWAALVQELRNSGTRVLFEIDDAFFDLRSAEHPLADVFGPDAAGQLEAVLAACDGAITTQERLAARLRRVNPRVWVCPNGLDLPRYAVSRVPGEVVTIGFAGAAGHRLAVEPWLDAVAAVMRARPETRFVSIGEDYAADVAARVGPQRCLAIPMSAFDTYPAAMANLDIAIAPSAPNAWYRGKSDLRWLEASALRLALVGDPELYPEMEHGVTGMHASTPAEAQAALLRLVDDPALRERIGHAARAHLERERDIAVLAPRWGEALRGVVANPGSPRVVAPELPSVTCVVAPADREGPNPLEDLELHAAVARAQDHPRTDVVVAADLADGLRAARGELVAVLHPGDGWPQGRLRALASGFLDHPRAALAHGDVRLLDVQGRELDASMRSTGALPILNGAVFGRLLERDAIPLGATAFRRELVDRILPFPVDGAEGWWVALSAARAAAVASVDDVVLEQRFDPRAAIPRPADVALARRLLTGPLDEVSPDEVLAALAALDARLAALAEHPSAAAAIVAGFDRVAALERMDAASAALDGGHADAALRALVAAVAHDPLFAPARELLDALAPHVLGR